MEIEIEGKGDKKPTEQPDNKPTLSEKRPTKTNKWPQKWHLSHTLKCYCITYKISNQVEFILKKDSTNTFFKHKENKNAKTVDIYGSQT